MYKNLTLRKKLLISFLSVAIITAITGFLGIYYSSSVGESGENVGVELAPLGDAAMEIKLTATTAHLIFEEILAGDATEDIDEVWKLLDESLWYCDAILSGGTNDEGTFVASTNPYVLKEINEVKTSLNNFIKSAHQRYDQRKGAVQVGSEVDQDFDQLYEKIQENLSNIINQNSGNGSKDLAHRSKYLLANGHLFFGITFIR